MDLKDSRVKDIIIEIRARQHNIDLFPLNYELLSIEQQNIIQELIDADIVEADYICGHIYSLRIKN